MACRSVTCSTLGQDCDIVPGQPCPWEAYMLLQQRHRTSVDQDSAAFGPRMPVAHHISNLTLCSGSVFVRNAAPMVDSCMRRTALSR